MSFNLAGNTTHSIAHDPKAEVSNSGEILFREFRCDGDDEEQMRELVFDNAFLGQPFDVICPCKQWFGDVVLTPYIRYQPENIHVAIHQTSGRLVGYLTGSMGGPLFEKLQYNMVRKQIITLAISLTMPWTLFDYAIRQFASHVIFKGEGERPSHPDTGVHWHFQVDKNFRGQGIGTTLFERFATNAKDAGFKHIWAEVMAYPEKPPTYYEDRGWHIYDARTTQIFGDHVDFPVQAMCIARLL